MTYPADPLRPVDTDAMPNPVGKPTRSDAGAAAGCACLVVTAFLALALGVVAGYLLGVTR